MANAVRDYRGAQHCPWRGRRYFLARFSTQSQVVSASSNTSPPLPRRVANATSFSERDKVLMVERVRSNDQGIKNPKWNWAQFREGVTDIYVWCFVTIALLK
jgi:hypothetical protein